MGEVFALVAALVWAFAVMFLRKSGETVSPLALNLFRVSVTAPLLVLTAVAVGQPLWGSAPLRDYLILFTSGIIAIAVSDTLLHMAINTVGAGISAIIGCSYSPLVALTAFVLLGERLGPWHIVGMVMVLGGVAVAARHKPPVGMDRRAIALGVIWGILAHLSLAIGIVIAKPVLNRSPVIWATAMRQVGSLIALVPMALISPRRRAVFGAFLPSASWRCSVPATLLGSYLALMAWIAGMKYTLTGIAAVLNQTSTVFILLLASVFLGEPVTRRKMVAAALAFAGILLVTYGDRM
jgi:drug/metabolite transporter (DMT)-like permease